MTEVKGTIKVKVYRFSPQKDKEPRYETYEVPFSEPMTVLMALNYIYENLDSSLAYNYSCRQGLCHACDAVVNGKAVENCSSVIHGDITIEPPLGFKVIKDLVASDVLVTERDLHLLAKKRTVDSARALSQGESQSAKPNARKFVSVDPNKCTGCGICEYVCTREKCGTWNPLASRIRVIRLTPFLNAAMACRFCKDAPCVKACTEKALVQSETSGVLTVDESKCDVCDWCMQACPYGGITIDPDKRIPIACDLCNGEPKCIEFCPEEALQLVEDDKAAEKIWTQAVQKIPSEIERLHDVVRKRKWDTVFTDAEERAKRTTGKLEVISKRERSTKQDK